MDEQLNFVQLIAERLTSVGIEYMLTGSMAMAAYGNPRMTRDVDVVIECSEKDADPIVRLFEKECYINRDAVVEAVANRSMFNTITTSGLSKLTSSFGKTTCTIRPSPTGDEKSPSPAILW